jgi:phosphoglycerate dehydrogenase-like enzyme
VHSPEEGALRTRPAEQGIEPILVWHPRGEEYRRALMTRLPSVPIEVRTGAPQAPARSEAGVLLTWALPPDAFDQLPRLRWMQATGAGVDELLRRDDLPDGLRVTRSVGRFGLQAAEYAVGYLLHWLLRIEDYRRNQDRGVWRQLPRPLLGDRTVGIIGLGAVGLAIAERLGNFGTHVVGVSRTARPLPHLQRVYAIDAWREMLPTCEALVVAAPLTDATRGMVDEAALRAMPAGSLLVNVARGAIVEAAALLATLRDGHLAAAVLDVFDQEPLPPDSPLWTEPRAWITPHVAAPSEIDPIADEFAANYQRFINGEPLHNEVDPEHGY